MMSGPICSGRSARPALPSLYRISRDIYRVARAQNAVRNPTRYAKNRAKSHALKAAGVWTIWRRFWRA
jgi:hypothetical protein